MDSCSRICRVCGKAFPVRPSHADKRFTCSRPCMAQEYKTRLRGENNPHFDPTRERVCPRCQARFHAKTPEQIYCSVPCYHPTRPQKNKASQPTLQLVLPFSRTFLRPKPKTLMRNCPICLMPFKERRHRRYCPKCSYIIRLCAVCETPFRIHRAMHDVTCSLTCRKQLMSIRQKGELSIAGKEAKHQQPGFSVTPQHIKTGVGLSLHVITLRVLFVSNVAVSLQLIISIALLIVQT